MKSEIIEVNLTGNNLTLEEIIAVARYQVKVAIDEKRFMNLVRSLTQLSKRNVWSTV